MALVPPFRMGRMPERLVKVEVASHVGIPPERAKVKPLVVAGSLT